MLTVSPTARWWRISGMDAKPVNLTEALASFDDIYSPRIVARMNDHDVQPQHLQFTRG